MMEQTETRLECSSSPCIYIQFTTTCNWNQLVATGKNNLVATGINWLQLELTDCNWNQLRGSQLETLSGLLFDQEGLIGVE